MTFDLPGIPSYHQLLAALEVLRVLPRDEAPIDPVRRGYHLLASDGVFGVSDYRVGEEILVAAGHARRTTDMISRDDEGHTPTVGLEACRLLLAQFLVRVRPAWIAAATRGHVVRPELIPTDAASALSTTIQDPGEREAFLLSMGQKYDDIALPDIGHEGELAVMSAWASELATRGRSDLREGILHVSLTSDALGYDVVAPDLHGEDMRLEVKTVGLTKRHLTVYLSRNEFETGVRDRRWRLVVCKRMGDGTIEVQGWLSASDIAAYVPLDRSELGAWATVRIDLVADQIRPGLPIGPMDIE